VQKLKKAFQTARYYGTGFLAFRIKYALQQKTGLLKRKFPTSQWSEIQSDNWLEPGSRDSDFVQVHKLKGGRFFFDMGNPPTPDKQCQSRIIADAEHILDNKFKYFFDKSYSLGAGPDWFLNPVTNKRAKADRHWCDIDLFDPDVGDIKFVWEPSRFAWAYTLIRAFAATRQDKYAEKFWVLWESWQQANQPNMGPNYACGQECAIRLLAMCFAFYALSDATATTNARGKNLALAIAVHADRIEKNIDFAVSTRTNHSLTEALGLYTAGLLFPEFIHSRDWVALGKKVLTTEGLKQIYTDGSYIQHSMNYHCLMLQDFLWGVRLAQLNGDALDDRLLSRLKKATYFLYQMQDEVTGKVPNYGANDGALILPLNSCDFPDYRPVLQAMNFLLTDRKLYEKGLWDEDLLWLFGPDALNAPIRPSSRTASFAADTGGYYILRGPYSRVMTRCHSYRDRPCHADMLHVDLWYKGENILRDAGSYMYYCQEAWQKYFPSTAAHNCVEIDDTDQMTKGPRFLWFYWTRCRLLSFDTSSDGRVGYFEGEHYGYTRLPGNVIHRRSICRIDNTYIIIDDIVGRHLHNVAMRWRMLPADWQKHGGGWQVNVAGQQISLTVNTPKSMNHALVKGQEAPAIEGWESLYYCQKKPTPTLVIKGNTSLPVCMTTTVSPADEGIEIKTPSFKDPKSAIVLSGVSDSELAECVSRLSRGRVRCV